MGAVVLGVRQLPQGVQVYPKADLSQLQTLQQLSRCRQGVKVPVLPAPLGTPELPGGASGTTGVAVQ